MDHKEMCIRWVEARKFEREDGRWQRCDSDGEPWGSIYMTETELDDALWPEALDRAHEDFIS
jgi:hypothetical protein